MPTPEEIRALPTERNNSETKHIDELDALGIAELINREDAKVAPAVASQLSVIADVISVIAQQLRVGGRLFYVGAGTSGRLGVVDASECPPTFGTAPELVQGFIAGGREAMFQSQEGAEDSREAGADTLQRIPLSSTDVVVGIAASGRTPYVLGALAYAAELGCATAIVTTGDAKTVQAAVPKHTRVIAVPVGPEVVAGSTRMKSGTAQKLVLNMLTTGAMVLLGKTYGNVMVDLQQTNEKLKVRSRNTLVDVCDCTYEEADALLNQTDGHVKTAIVVHMAKCSPHEARLALQKHDGFVKKTLADLLTQ